MSALLKLDPRGVLRALDAIDRQWGRTSTPEWRSIAGLLTLVAICLLGIHYLKSHAVFREVVFIAAGPEVATALLAGPWGHLAAEAWWGLVHVIGYVVVPVVYLWSGPRIRALDVGLRWRDTTSWLGWYALLAAPIVVFAFVASFTEAFTQTYPFYGLAGRSWVDLFAWEMIYLMQFVCLEFFFRGFMLERLAPRIGAGAIFVMVVPYMMIHLSKPWPEAFGAILFGIVLGILALRSRSIWGGALVHMTIALSMDVMSLAQTGRWPVQVWP